MISPEIDRQLFDTLLQEAVRENHHREMAAVPSEDELAGQYAFSPAFDPKMRRLLRKDRLASLFHAWRYPAKTATAAVIILLTLALGGLLLVPEVRAAVVNVVIEWLDTHTSFHFTEDTPAPTSWRPSYLPGGFYEASVIETGKITNVVYKNAEETAIYFIYAPAQAGYSFAIDNEHSDYAETSIDGIKINLFRARSPQDSNHVIWQQGSLSFGLMSTIHYQELLKMAESVINKIN